MITSEKLNIANYIETRREKAKENDKKEFQERRRQWIDNILSWDTIELREIYPYDNENGAIKTKSSKELNQFHNCRTGLSTETCLEVDKLGFDKVIPLYCEICLSLMRGKIHFAIFFSEGGRSPYIFIYDFNELADLTDLQRIKAQVLFWKKHVPFGFFHYFDTSIFNKEQLRPLEFGIHWKTGNPFNLLFEHNPFPIKNYSEIIREKRAYSELRAYGKTHEEARRELCNIY